MMWCVGFIIYIRQQFDKFPISSCSHLLTAVSPKYVLSHCVRNPWLWPWHTQTATGQMNSPVSWRGRSKQDTPHTGAWLCRGNSSTRICHICTRRSPGDTGRSRCRGTAWRRSPSGHSYRLEEDQRTVGWEHRDMGDKWKSNRETFKKLDTPSMCVYGGWCTVQWWCFK